MTRRPFYNWWTRADHDALLCVLRRLKPRIVLEFGPGLSTQTLLDGGARWVDTFENEPRFYDDQRGVYATEPRVHVHLYRRRDPLYLPSVRTPRYDLAFVDGPRWSSDRGPELVYARDHARAVAVHDLAYPETHDLIWRHFPHWRLEPFTTNTSEALGLLTRPETTPS